MKIKLLAIAIAILCYSKTNATVYYVNGNATGNGNGLSWTNAFTDIQSALSIVIFGDEIWVSAGQYKPTTTTARTVAFVLKNGVNLYGGFSGTETSISQRNINSNPTILNGDIGQLGLDTDNSHNVIRAATITSDIIVDGFRIINGNTGSSYVGGGVKISNSINGTLSIKNCYFFSNKAHYYGGAIHLENAKVIIENCEFRNNSTNGGEGGAIYTLSNGNNSSLTIKGSKFIGNTSYIGACIANSNTYQNLIIDRCIFTNNTAEHSIVAVDHFINAKIYNSMFVGNTVDALSGTVIEASHYANSTEDNFEMINCTIADNFNLYSNIQGEMVSLYKSYYKVKNCIIHGNTKYQGRQINVSRDVTNSLVEGGYSGANIDGNPFFLNPNNAIDVNFDALSYNYTLDENSPAINSGSNTFLNEEYNLDLNNNTRLVGPLVDMGSYESSSVMSSDTFRLLKDNYYFNYNTSELIFTDYTKYLNSIIDIYTLDGRNIRQVIVASPIIDIELATGIYILRLDNDKTLKIIVK